MSRKTATNTAILATLGLLIAGGGAAIVQNERAGAAEADAAATYSPQTFPTPTSTPAMSLDLPEDPRVLVLGDSFSLGVGAEPRSRGYVTLTAENMGWADVTVDGAGATGFVADNKGRSPVYADRLRDRAGDPAPDLVILQGAVNDTSATNTEMREGVTAALDEIRGAWPEAEIVVTAPIAYRSFARVEGAMVAALEGEGVVYLNDSTPSAWLPQSPELYAEDGWHPSTEGHARIAKMLSAALQDRIG